MLKWVFGVMAVAEDLILPQNHTNSFVHCLEIFFGVTLFYAVKKKRAAGSYGVPPPSVTLKGSNGDCSCATERKKRFFWLRPPLPSERRERIFMAE